MTRQLEHESGSERVALLHGHGITVERVEAYLPRGYRVVLVGRRRDDDGDTVVIAGTDHAGWTLDGYVLPRLASGGIYGSEVLAPDPQGALSFDEVEAAGLDGTLRSVGAANPDEYNGWTNRETWAAALHLSNDEGLYRCCVELVADADADDEHGAGSIAAADAIDGFVTEAVDGFLFGDESPEWVRLMMSDVGSFWRVDWTEVAASFREDVAS